MPFDFLVFIGRFEPFHNGHRSVIEHALQLARQVIILIGSAYKPCTLRNPWSAAEREAMIRVVFASDSTRLVIQPLRDHLYNDMLWAREVQRLVSAASIGVPNAKIGLIGHHQGGTSNYLSMFPHWDAVHAPPLASLPAIDVLETLFASDASHALHSHTAVPHAVLALLQDFRDEPRFTALQREHQFIKTYRQGWASAPYEPSFVTVDAVLVHSCHVLLIQRRAEPGKGLWAFPGGFVDPHETLQSAVLRELREETLLTLPQSLLLGSLKHTHVFDHPQRSLRGRTFTHGYFFEFPDGELPPVKGSDDAQHAQWLPLATALEMEPQFFEDHYHILEYFIGRA